MNFYNDNEKINSNGKWVLAEEYKRFKKEKNAEITRLRDCLEEKNKQLDILHNVWCSGGCPSGLHRLSKNNLTEEQIKRAERYIYRVKVMDYE